MRIAFITPEFVTDHRNAEGLGNYLFRIGKLLEERGHQAEVFVSSGRNGQVHNLRFLAKQFLLELSSGKHRVLHRCFASVNLKQRLRSSVGLARE